VMAWVGLSISGPIDGKRVAHQTTNEQRDKTPRRAARSAPPGLVFVSIYGGLSSPMYAPRLSRYSTVRSSTLPPAYQAEKPVPCQARRWMVSSRQRSRLGLRRSLLNADAFAVLACP